MLDGIFDHWLQQHAGHKSIEGLFVDFFEDLQFVAAEADDFDVQIIVDKTDLIAQGHERFMFPQQAAKDIRELQDDHAGRILIVADQRGDGI